MKTFRFVLIVVLLSVLLNVLIAWTAAILINADTLPAEEVLFKRGYEEFSEMANGPLLSTWSVTTRRGVATTQVNASLMAFVGVSSETIELSVEHPRSGLPTWSNPYIKVNDSNMMHCIGRGWPLVALVTDQERIPPGPIGGPRTIAKNVPLREAKTGWVLESMPWDSGRPRILPTRIIWKGFIGNSSLYAAVILLPFIARWLKRRIKGQCTSCGYDLRGTDHEQCPECGTPIKRAKPA